MSKRNVKHYQGEIWGSSKSARLPVKIADIKLQASNRDDAELIATGQMQAELSDEFHSLQLRNLKEVQPD